MIRKLTLDLDALAVATFESGAAEAHRGTVAGNAARQPRPWSQPLSCQATLHTCASFDVSCRADG
ncbi:MAG: hypothetical protein JO306_11960 [Gemmatimonadetes bacterium]|nr:hypothetical protein [Gemmatimonadota bacterium]